MPRAPRTVRLRKGRQPPRAKPGGRGGALAPRVPGHVAPPLPAGVPLLRAGREPTLTRPLGALASPTPTVFSATGVPGLFWHDSVPQLSVTSCPSAVCHQPRAPGPAAWRAPRKRLPRPGSGGSAVAVTLGGAPAPRPSGRPGLAKPRVAREPGPRARPTPAAPRRLSRLRAPHVRRVRASLCPQRGPPRGFKCPVKARPWVEGGKKEDDFTIGARVTVSSTPQRLACPSY